MTKPFIKQKPFSRRSSAPNRRAASSAAADVLPLSRLNNAACFETLRAYAGKIFRLDEHCRRLEESCHSVGAPLPVSKKELAAWLKAGLKESGFHDALLRVSVERSGEAEGTLVLIVREFHAHPAEWYEKGVAVRSVVPHRSLFKAQDPQIKASQFVAGVLAVLDQGNERSHEMIFLGPVGTVAEGSVSNIFIIKGKTLLTPSVASGILRGVTRDFVIRIAEKMPDLSVRETFLTRHDVYTADECFITNTSSEILPVVEMDRRVIGQGRPGEWTKKLMKRFKTARENE